MTASQKSMCSILINAHKFKFLKFEKWVTKAQLPLTVPCVKIKKTYTTREQNGYFPAGELRVFLVWKKRYNNPSLYLEAISYVYFSYIFGSDLKELELEWELVNPKIYCKPNKKVPTIHSYGFGPYAVNF